MAKLIELRDGNYVDPGLIFQVNVLGASVIVRFGRDLQHANREQFACNTRDEANALAAKIVGEVNFSAELSEEIARGKEETMTEPVIVIKAVSSTQLAIACTFKSIPAALAAIDEARKQIAAGRVIKEPGKIEVATKMPDAP